MKNYPIRQFQLFIVVLLTSFCSLQSMANQNLPFDEIAPCGIIGEWIEMSPEKGVNISYSMVSCHGETFLAIKFENPDNSPIDFVWSLAQNSERMVITEDEMHEQRLHLDANETTIYKGSYLIPIADEDDYLDLKVSIQSLKK